jgi:hypothetical protein
VSPAKGYTILSCQDWPTHRVYVVQDNETRMQRNARVLRGPLFAWRARRKIERTMRPWPSPALPS